MHLRLLSWKIKNRNLKYIVLGIITHVQLCSSPAKQSEEQCLIAFWGTDCWCSNI